MKKVLEPFGRFWQMMGLRTPEVQPNGENATLEELRVAMEAAPNKRSYIRLNAIRALLLGCRARRCVSSFVAPTGCCGYGSRCSIAAALTR
ncbi:MAG: hypothetical protein U1F83_00850 [Verrucomicrobiota bacterium]